MDSDELAEQEPLLPASDSDGRCCQACEGVLCCAAKDQEDPLWRRCFRILICPVIVFALGVGILCRIENWTPLTSTYVVTQMVTTVGYGDFIVHSRGAKIFVAVYSMVLLTFAASAVGFLADKMLVSNSATVVSYLRDLDFGEHHERCKGLGKVISATVPCLVFLAFGTIFYRLTENCVCGNFSPVGCNDIDFKTCEATGGKIKHWADTFYLSVMTLATIGFGDFKPETVLGRVVAIPWMIAGFAAFANMLAGLTAFFYESRKSEKMMAADSTVSITRDVFRELDRESTGYLDKGEFLAYTLMKYELVSEDLISEVFREYDECKSSQQGVTYLDLLNRQRRAAATTQKRRKAEAGIATTAMPPHMPLRTAGS